MKAGGTLVCQEPGKLGLSGRTASASRASVPSLGGAFRCGKGKVLVLRGSVSQTWTDDAGANFLRTYAPELRAGILRLAQSLGLAPIIPGDAGGLVSAFPVVQPGRKRLVVHLVNYDIDYDTDRIRQRADVPLSLRCPAFLRGKAAARLFAPGEEARALEVRRSGGRLLLAVPRLGVSAAVVVW